MGMANGFAVIGGFGLRQRLLRFHQAGVALQHEQRGGLVGFGHVLGNLRQTPIGGHVKFATVFVQAAIEQGEQGGFARAVAADQANFFPRIQGNRGLVQQNPGATAQLNVAQCDHARACSAWAVSRTTCSSPAEVGSQRPSRVGKAASK